MSKFSRRSVVTTAAALPALAVPAVAADASDAEMRRLWGLYLDRMAEHKVAEAKLRPVSNALHAQINAEFPDTRALNRREWDARELRWKALEEQLGTVPLREVWSDSGSRVNRISETIQQTPAESLFGVGVKLAAQAAFADEQDADCLRALIQATVADIDRLLGSDFSAHVIFVADEDHEELRGRSHEDHNTTGQHR
jgi:hypothetical protein